MYRYVSYIWLTVAVLFVQIFLLDNISVALWLRPMIFPLVVLLLPMEWRTVWVLLSALGVGCVMDLALGGAGLYTASLLPVAVMRRSVMYVTTRRSVEAGDHAELLSKLSLTQLMLYLGAAMALHHILFFVLETLSFKAPFLLLAVIVASTIVSMLLAWPIARLFLVKVVVK